MNKLTNLPPTEELQAIDAAHHIHPFSDMGALNKKGTRVIARAEGVYLYDSDGNKILDAMAGLWCVNIGYGRQEVTEAVTRQMAELPYYNTFFQTSHPPVIALSEKLAQLSPDGITHSFFNNSGSESNDTVMRMVRHYWVVRGQATKKIIISRKNAYHGSTMAGASLGGMKPMHAQGGLPIPGVHHIDQPYWYREGGSMDPKEFSRQRAQALQRAIDELGADNIAAFIGEPIQGAGGVVIPEDTYWPEIQRICKANDILLVADEVICGFGRTGEWFGCDSFGIVADIMPIAKGLSSGYLPIGGVMVRQEVANTLADAGAEFAHGYTYSGHPVACAAALANLEIMEQENLVGYVRDDAAPYLQDAWKTLEDHPLVGEARTFGLLGALELTPDKAERADFPGEGGVAGGICRDACVDNGLVIRAVRDTMVISPPLCITHGEIDELLGKVRKSLDDCLPVMKALGLIN